MPTPLDIAQNSVESAQIALDQAKLKLQQAQVVAPFDGVVTAVNAKVGQSASGTAFTIADLDHLEIVVNMSEVDVNQIKTGQSVEVTLDAVPDADPEGHGHADRAGRHAEQRRGQLPGHGGPRPRRRMPSRPA